MPHHQGRAGYPLDSLDPELDEPGQTSHKTSFQFNKLITRTSSNSALIVMEPYYSVRKPKALTWTE